MVELMTRGGRGRATGNQMMSAALVLGMASLLCSLVLLRDVSNSRALGRPWMVLVGDGADAKEAAAEPTYDTAAAEAECKAIPNYRLCLKEPFNPDPAATFARKCWFKKGKCSVAENYQSYFSITQPPRPLSRYLSPRQRSSRGRESNSPHHTSQYSRLPYPGQKGGRSLGSGGRSLGGSGGRSLGARGANNGPRGARKPLPRGAKKPKGAKKPLPPGAKQPLPKDGITPFLEVGEDDDNEDTHEGDYDEAYYDDEEDYDASVNGVNGVNGVDGGNGVNGVNGTDSTNSTVDDDWLETEEQTDNQRDAKEERALESILGDLEPAYSDQPHHHNGAEFGGGTEPYGGLRLWKTEEGDFVHHNFSQAVYDRWARHHAHRRRIEWCQWGTQMVPCAPGFGGAWYSTGHRWRDKGIWRQVHFHPDHHHAKGMGSAVEAGWRTSDYLSSS